MDVNVLLKGWNDEDQTLFGFAASHRKKRTLRGKNTYYTLARKSVTEVILILIWNACEWYFDHPSAKVSDRSDSDLNLKCLWVIFWSCFWAISRFGLILAWSILRQPFLNMFRWYPVMISTVWILEHFSKKLQPGRRGIRIRWLYPLLRVKTLVKWVSLAWH